MVFLVFNLPSEPALNLRFLSRILGNGPTLSRCQLGKARSLLECTAPEAQPDHFDFWKSVESAHLAQQHQRPNYHSLPVTTFDTPSEVEANAKPLDPSRHSLAHTKYNPKHQAKLRCPREITVTHSLNSILNLLDRRKNQAAYEALATNT